MAFRQTVRHLLGLLEELEYLGQVGLHGQSILFTHDAQTEGSIPVEFLVLEREGVVEQEGTKGLGIGGDEGRVALERLSKAADHLQHQVEVVIVNSQEGQQGRGQLFEARVELGRQALIQSRNQVGDQFIDVFLDFIQILFPFRFIETLAFAFEEQLHFLNELRQVVAEEGLAQGVDQVFQGFQDLTHHFTGTVI